MAVRSQCDKLPGVLVLVHITPALDEEEDEDLHAAVVLAEPWRVPCCLQRVMSVMDSLATNSTRTHLVHFVHDCIVCILGRCGPTVCLALALSLGRGSSIARNLLAEGLELDRVRSNSRVECNLGLCVVCRNEFVERGLNVVGRCVLRVNLVLVGDVKVLLETSRCKVQLWSWSAPKLQPQMPEGQATHLDL